MTYDICHNSKHEITEKNRGTQILRESNVNKSNQEKQDVGHTLFVSINEQV